MTVLQFYIRAGLIIGAIVAVGGYWSAHDSRLAMEHYWKKRLDCEAVGWRYHSRGIRRGKSVGTIEECD